MNKISEGIKEKGGRIEIPDCDRGDFPEFLVEQGFKIGAEIGVYKGEYSAKFLEKGLKLFSIDPWRSYEDYGSDASFHRRQEELYSKALKRIGKFPNSTIIRKTSMEAVNDFKDGSLDFVYIDGHHGFKYIAEDIWEWSKKVRKGGIIAGHDYAIPSRKKPTTDKYNCHVKHVVDAYTSATGIDTWYVIGRGKPLEGEKRDSWRSWFWFKNED